jgi:hypothetical protein
LDNIKLINGTAPTAASNQPKLITNFDNGSNLITWTGVSGNQSPGAIYIAGGWPNSSGDTPIDTAGDLPPGEPTAHTLPSGDTNATVWNTCPPAGAIGASFFPSAPGYNSPWAAHVTGTFGDDSYPYIQLGMNLQNPRFQTDLSSFSGITFWAKLGSTAGAWSSYFVKFPNAFSDPMGGICNNSTYSVGGNNSGLIDGVNNTNANCANDHGVSFTWNTTWTQYTVDFKTSQADPLYPGQAPWWGQPGPGDGFGGSNNNGANSIDFQTGNSTVVGETGLTPIQTIYAVQFQTNGSASNQQGSVVDFWIDDVTFY